MTKAFNGVPAELIPEWDEVKNDVEPNEARGPVKYWWLCLNGKHEHSYERSLNTKNILMGCPYCSGKKVIAGFNDALSAHPELEQQWSDKNTLSMEEITPFSSKSYWWECAKGHEWQASMKTRANSHSCPYCSGNKADHLLNGILDGFKNEWDFDRNKTDGVSLDKVTSGSGVKAWWRGSQCGHSWKASILHRKNGSGCPYCSGNKVLPGFNDFATHSPQWVHLWHPERNGDVTPSSVMKQSPGKRWWMCVQGHEWEQSPKKMASIGPRCPECSQVFSRLEAIVHEYLLSVYTGEIQPRRRIIEHTPGYRGRWEIDLLLPSLKLGFEVQDFATHSRESDDEQITYRGIDGVKAGPTKHELKRRLAIEQHGIIIVDIWEDEIFDGTYRGIIDVALASATKIIAFSR